MKKFVNRLRAERGFTLLEMMASLALLSIVLGLVYSITVYGMRSYHKIGIENSLRDEADLLMSSVITELYTSVPDQILPVKSGDGISGLVLQSDNASGKVKQLIQISEGHLYIGPYTPESDENTNGGNGWKLPDEQEAIAAASRMDLSAPSTTNLESAVTGNFSLNCGGLTACSTGSIGIELILTQTYGGMPYEMTLKSKFGF